MKKTFTLLFIFLSLGATGMAQPKEMKQCLDSVISSSVKYYFSYDEKGNMDTAVCYQFSDLQIWVGTYYQINSYNYLKNTKLTSVYSWNYEQNIWMLSTLYEVEYDDSGRVLTFIYSFWDSDIQSLKKDTKRKYEYIGNQTIEETYTWSDNKNDWLKSYKYEEDYYDNGELKIKVNYMGGGEENDIWILTEKKEIMFGEYGSSTEYWWIWEDEDWKYTKKNASTNDSSGNFTAQMYDWKECENMEWDWFMISKVKQDYDIYGNTIYSESFYWDFEINDWRGSKDTVMFYDEHGNFKEKWSYDWDYETQKWVYFFKEEYQYEYYVSGKIKVKINRLFLRENNDWTELCKAKNEYGYDSNGRQIQNADYYWDYDLKDWVGSNNFGKEFDSNNNERINISHRWDQNKKDWIETIKNEFEFNFAYTLSDLLFIDKETDYALNEKIKKNNNMLVSETTYFGGVKIEEMTYYWSAKNVAGITENTNSSTTVTVYPNPVSNILNIKTENDLIPNVKIYSIQGVLLINTKENHVDFSSFPTGIYIANINGTCHKIVKQ